MAVDRKLLQQALQQGQDTTTRAIQGTGFDPRGGWGVAAAQIGTAALGAYQQSKAKKALLEEDQISQQAFASKFPQFAGLANNLSRETRDAISLKAASAQLDQQYKEPKEPKFSIQKTDQGLYRVNEKTGESFAVTNKEGKTIGIPTPKAPEPRKPLSEGAAKTLTISTGGINSINKLNELLGDSGTVSFKSTYGSDGTKTPKERQISLLSKDLADSIGRLRSGGAINKDEEKTFIGFVPNPWDDAETVQFKLGKLGEKFVSVQAGITGQEMPQAELKLGKQQSKANPFSQDAIQAEMARRGLK